MKLGEAKSKSKMRGAEPCKCGSGRPAATCCFDGRIFVKHPAKIVLANPLEQLSVEGCYLASTFGCGGVLSKEHLVSESVLKVLNLGDLLTISGAAWQAPGETRRIGLSALTAKCLCERHNNECLSSLDAAAGSFFFAVNSAASNESMPPTSFLVSGHDIERWMLKTLFALAHGKILTREKQLIARNFYAGIDVTRLLTDPIAWDSGAGMYSRNSVGDTVTRRNQLDISALTMPDTDAYIGLRFSLLGLSFEFLADFPSTVHSNQQLTVYRPGRLAFRHGSVVNDVLISWDDGRRHEDIILDAL